MFNEINLKNLYFGSYKGKFANEIKTKGEPILEKWKEYREKILNGTLTLDEYTNRKPNNYLCNFLENESHFFGSSHTGSAAHFMVKLNSDGTYSLIKAGGFEKNSKADRPSAERYFKEYVLKLLQEIISCKNFKELIGITESIAFNQYHSKNSLLKIILLESLTRKDVDFYSSILTIYKQDTIDKLCEDFALNSVGNRTQKSYDILRKSYEILGIESANKNIETVYEISAMLWDNREKLRQDQNTGDKRKTEGDKGVTEMGNTTESLPKNIILYGPPGTGKTYNSIIRAVNIIEGKTFFEKGSKFEEIKKRYNDYVKEGKIAFTTFHQSYGYEEFIEGIKPVIDDENDGGEIKYKVQDGIFKEFCLKAEKPVARKMDLKSFGINENPTFWKVSLNGTGDNEIRRDCLNNGYIRIAFDSYGKNVTDESDFTKEGGRNVLNAFISGMKNGDIVLSCYSNTSIDAIGVIEGDYEWREDFSEYKRVRKVKWLVKGKIQDVDKHNDNKALTLGTVYKLNDIDKDWIYGLIEQEKSKNENVEKEESKDDRRVFIIDEINRGNISKIFGELITLIEDTKRIGQQEEMKAILPYSKKEFGVPDNVYIIGTMNTADRSIALMDTALRRRFAFEEMPPKPELLNADIEGINVKTVLETINKRIEFLYDREHTIGHSFFMKLKEDGATIGNLADIFKNKIIPLLQEYFYDDYEKIRLVLGDNQKEDEQCQFIKRVSENFDKLFGESELKDSLEDKTTVYEINSAAFYKKESYNCLCGQPKNDENETMNEAAVTTNENENE